MTACEAFGSTLRQQRERHGMTLDAVARITKISPHMLTSLERGDVSRWPGGIYRRSFLRAYAAAIQLPPDVTLREFVRLFPEPGQDPPVLLDDDPRRLRITLEPVPRWQVLWPRCLAGTIDGLAVLVIGSVAAALSGGALWMLTAAVALTYHAASTAVLGQTPAMWCVESAPLMRTSPSTSAEIARLRHGWLSDLLEPAPETTPRQAVT